MKFDMTMPCDACPFLATANMKRAFTLRRLSEFASAAFHCHKTGIIDEDDEDSSGDFVATANSSHCAGMLIFLEKRGRPNQMMRIGERLGMYDSRKLDMSANVR